MKHDYPSYSVPAPVIKNPRDILEDIRGNLMTTHKIAAHLGGELAEMEGVDSDWPIGCIKERIGLFESMSAVVEDRIKDAIILLDATVDANGENMTDPRPFAEAVAYYSATSRSVTMIPEDGTRKDGAVSLATAALDALVALPAPTIGALAEKMEIVGKEGYFTEAWAHLIADARRLAGLK